jgi:hypothetical protein
MRRNRFNLYMQRRPERATALKWHLCLGHSGLCVVEYLVNLFLGVKICGPTTAECEDCVQGKIHQQIRWASRYERKDELKSLDWIALDFHDMERDYDNYNSVMLLIDRATGYIWDYYLKDRMANTIIAVLKQVSKAFINWYSRTFDIIECDNEITIVKPRVKEYLESQGHSIESLASDMQEQNGGAERSGGVIKEKARTMGINLPQKLVMEVFKAAVYLYNRSPRATSDWKTSYECLFGCKPGQEHLRVYGCKVYAMTIDAKQCKNRLQKLNPKVWLGYLVGYTLSNIFCIWIPIKNRIISICDALFDEEDIFDGKLESLCQDIKEVDLEDLALTLQ